MKQNRCQGNWYKANTDESNTANPYPPITHPHTCALKLMHTVKIYQHSHEILSWQRVKMMTCTLWCSFLEADIFHPYCHVCYLYEDVKDTKLRQQTGSGNISWMGHQSSQSYKYAS